MSLCFYVCIYLFSVVVFQGSLETFLHSLKGNAHIYRPPNLTASQCDLRTRHIQMDTSVK